MIPDLDKKIAYLKSNGVEPEFFITKTKMVRLCDDDDGIHCFISYKNPDYFYFDNENDEAWPMVLKEFEQKYEEIQNQFVPEFSGTFSNCIDQLVKYEKFLNNYGYTSCNMHIEYDIFYVTAIRSETEFEFYQRLIEKIKEVKTKKASETKERKKKSTSKEVKT